MSSNTLAKMKSGSWSIQWIAAIEGCPYLLTDGDPDAAVAFASTTGQTMLSNGDYSHAVGGLVVELDNEQTLDPWNPFKGAGSLALYVQSDNASDLFGTLVAQTRTGAQTRLISALNRTGTSIGVKRSDDFPAAPGELFIGTECIEYSVINNTNAFTAGIRGKYTPLSAGGSGAPRFAQYHRVDIDQNQVPLQPVVSQVARTWVGRRVCLWACWFTGDAIDSVVDAQRMFAGVIAEVRDDGKNTILQVKHELDRIANAVIGQDMWQGTLQLGSYLAAGYEFDFVDVSGTGSWNTANALKIVSTTPSGADQMASGYYTPTELCQVLNAWLAAELAASRIVGTYTLDVEAISQTETRVVMHYSIPSTGGATGAWGLSSTGNSSYIIGAASVWEVGPVSTAAGHAAIAPNPPAIAPFLFAQGNQNAGNAGGGTSQCLIDVATGVFVDQWASLPTGIRAWFGTTQPALPTGLLLYNNKQLLAGQWDAGTKTIVNLYPFASLAAGSPGDISALDATQIAAGDPPPALRQIVVIAGAFKDVIRWMFRSTGTTGYNHATDDILPYGFGLAIPDVLLGTNFDTTVSSLPSAEEQIAVVIDKPRKFAEQFQCDFVLRRTHLIWSSTGGSDGNGGLELSTWATPTTDTTVGSLDDTSKAVPAGNRVNQPTQIVWDSSWVKNLVKINYDRDLTNYTGISGDQGYQSSLTLANPTSIDDAGGVTSPQTLNALNSYGQYQQVGSGIEALAPDFLSWFPLFSEPLLKITRPIDVRQYEGLGVGDVVAVSDSSVRDPTTGQRGISALPGLIVRHRYNPGGPTPGDPTTARALAGEVDIIFLSLDRVAVYAPAAEIDSTAANGGYNDTSHTLTCLPNEHTLATEVPPDDAGWFSAGDVVVIIELDPSNPASPLSWQKTVLNVSGNNIQVDSSLTSWDSTKHYRVISATYASAVAAQRLKAYQAGSDSTIVQLATPNQYGAGAVAAPDVDPDHTTLPSLPANASYGPNTGAPRDTGYDRDLATLLDNLYDHKTARQSPCLDLTERSNVGYSGWQTLFVRPIFLGSDMLGAGVTRGLYVAPLARSLTGASVSFRVTLTSQCPTDSTVDDMTIGAPQTSVEWTGITSTTAEVLTEQRLELAALNGAAVGWLVIEATLQGATRGLAECIERERE